MSVPSWERDLSRTQYIYEAYKMCIDIGHIVASHPKKYRMNYGDTLINESLDVLKMCRLANSIFVTKDTPEDALIARKKYLLRARLLATNLSSVADVYLGLCYNQDGVKRDKIERQQRRIGSSASNIVNLINGVIRHDRDVTKKSS